MFRMIIGGRTNTSESHYENHLLSDDVNLKKYFYALRPLLAAKWILDKKSVPPMLFEELMETELVAELKSEIMKLLIMKKGLPEMGRAPRIQVINEYIEAELARIKVIAGEMEDHMPVCEPLNELFLRMVR